MVAIYVVVCLFSEKVKGKDKQRYLRVRYCLPLKKLCFCDKELHNQRIRAELVFIVVPFELHENLLRNLVYAA